MQETKDGELVVLHDLASVLAACAGHAANEEVLQELRAAGIQFDDPQDGRTKVRVRRISTAPLIPVPCLSKSLCTECCAAAALPSLTPLWESVCSPELQTTGSRLQAVPVACHKVILCKVVASMLLHHGCSACCHCHPEQACNGHPLAKGVSGTDVGCSCSTVRTWSCGPPSTECCRHVGIGLPVSHQIMPDTGHTNSSHPCAVAQESEGAALSARCRRSLASDAATRDSHLNC